MSKTPAIKPLRSKSLIKAKPIKGPKTTLTEPKIIACVHDTTLSLVKATPKAIKTRNKEGITSEFTFIGIKESTVENYEKIKDNLFATVKFVAEVISVKKDKQNKIIEGNPDKIKFVTDSWKFTRNIKQKDPNWYLSEIISK